jgi:hypothetical protein
MCSGSNNKHKTITSQTVIIKITVTARTISSAAINIRGRRGLRDRGKRNPKEWSYPKEVDPRTRSK